MSTYLQCPGMYLPSCRSHYRTKDFYHTPKYKGPFEIPTREKKDKDQKQVCAILEPIASPNKLSPEALNQILEAYNAAQLVAASKSTVAVSTA